MNRYAIRETRKNGNGNMAYSLLMPSFNEPGFYRQTVSLNAFFNGTKKRNWKDWETNGTLYTCVTWAEFLMDQETWASFCAEKHLDIAFHWPYCNTEFNGIWNFYKYIGYDYKTKKWI
jgi:hypothetical protein